jgi:hypothetical protein
MPDWRRARVECSVLGIAFEGGVTIRRGAVVDLDARIGGGQILRPHVREEWFEPLAPEPSKEFRNGD